MIAISANLIVHPSTVTSSNTSTTTTTTATAIDSSIINLVTKDSDVPFTFNHRSPFPMQQQHGLENKFISMNEDNMSAYYNDNFNFTQQSTTNWSERILHDIIGFLHILSPAGKVLYCSESCLELTGYSSHELIGKSLTDFIHVDDLDIFARNFQLAFSSLIRIKVHYRIRRKDNTYLLLESIGHPKQDILDRPPQSFFAIAQPYLSRSNGLLDSFLELKMENEWLKKRLSDLLPYQPQQQQQQQQQQQIRQPQPQPQQQLQQNHQHQQQLQQPQQQQPQQQQQLQHQQQNQQFKSYSQSFLSNNNDNNILLATNEHYFMNHTSPKNSSRRPSSSGSTMFQTSSLPMADDNINNNSHSNTETNKYSPSTIGSVEFNEMLVRYNEKEDTNSGGMATTTCSYLSSNNSILTDISSKDKWKRRKKHRGVDDYVCADCGTTASPEWRKGPHGPKTLCNACGLRWAKKNKKI